MGDRPASRAVLREIRDERRVVEEGHRFLDEKRVMLAQSIVERLSDWRGLAERLEARERSARDALAEAMALHGLAGLLVHPPWAIETARPEWHARSFLGVSVAEDAALSVSEARSRPEPVLPSREAEETAAAFRDLLAGALEQAVALATLERLAEAYVETDRRTRALEDVVLPETRAAERRMDDHLEALEQEEAVRLRMFAHGR
jgi:V/A-type H+-transporting ATPase subunit D